MRDSASRRLVEFAAAFWAVLLLKVPTLHDAPMWDTAMGLFPAALVLNSNGFDLLAVLRAPGYGFGGPNTHTTSIVTVMTALVLRVAGGFAIPVLHVIQVGATAFGLTLFYRLTKPILGERNAIGLSAAALLFPLFLVQAGRLYLEIPLFLCAVGMVHAHLNGSYLKSVVWATAAFAVKENGIIVPFALAVLLLLEAGPWKVRVRRTVLAVIPSVAVLAFPAVLALGALTGGSQPFYQLFPPPGQAFAQLGGHLTRFLLRVPDVLVLMVLFLVSLPSQARDVSQGLRHPRNLLDSDPQTSGYLLRLRAAVAVLILAYLGLYFIALPLVVNFTLVLPRYHTIIVPFLLFWVTLRIHGSTNGRLTFPFIGAVLLWGVLNYNGALYPSDIDTEGPGNDFALTERSMAYRSLDRVQRDAVDHLATLPGSYPIFYGPYEHYLTNYPGLGYTHGPLPNGRLMHLDHQWQSVVEASPCVYAVYNHPWLGGERIRTLAEEVAPALGMVHDTAASFREGRYVVTIHRFQRSAGDCAT